jgi:PAS domain S-box-containing protein
VAVVGVANKDLPYTEQDAIQLELMMAEVWRITKRLELELKLIHAGHEWQITFDAISDSVSLIDLDQRVVRCNRASTRYFRQGFKDVIGQHCWKLVHGTDHPIEDCPMQRAKQSRATESQLIFEGGRWLQVSVDPLLNEAGDMIGAVHIVHDDTERVTTEQSRLELLAMLEAVQNELYVFKPDTLLFEYVNQSAQHNLGYPMAQLLQMGPMDLKPLSRQQFLQLLTPLALGEQQLLRFETTHQRADGSSYPIEVNLQLVETRSGSRYLAVIHDTGL